MNPCSVCPRLFEPIRGDGPQPCKLMGIGERPGENDNKLDQVFIGRAGEELDYTYLPLAGLRRGEDIRLTNACKCFAEHNKTPTDKEIQICGHHWLPREIERCKPEVIVLLGGSAAKLTNGLINLETHHGRPLKVNNFVGSGWSGWVWPTYHPASGMHKTDQMNQLLEDFELLGKWLRGRWTPPKPIAKKIEYLLLDNHYILDDRLRPAKNLWPAVDTERHGPTSFSVQVSPRPGYGYMVMADTEFLMKKLARWINESCNGITLHNAPQDLDELAKLRIYPKAHRDTMQEAFHQGNQPQKLKALAYRLLGVTMRTWEDVVRPASVDKALEWISEALTIAQEDLQLADSRVLKTRLCKECGSKVKPPKPCKNCGGDKSVPLIKDSYKGGPTESALKRIIRYSSNPEYDIWEKVDEIWTKSNGMLDHDRAHIENRLGVMPILGIGNCKLSEAVEYGCSDADHTGQVATALEEKRNGERYKIDDDDADRQDTDIL